MNSLTKEIGNQPKSSSISADVILKTLNSKLNIADAQIICNYKKWNVKF